MAPDFLHVLPQVLGEGVRATIAQVAGKGDADHTGYAVAAVNAGGPSLRLSLAELKRITGHVVSAAASISRELGHRLTM